MVYSSYRVFIVVFIMLCTVSIDIAWKHYLQNSVRVTAKYNLNQVKTCVNDLLLGNDSAPIYNTRLTNDDIEKALKTCAREMRTTPTGDMFAFSLRTLDFVFDPSLDCFIEGGKKMSKESECGLHEDSLKCEEIIPLMTAGYDSDINQLHYWQFDNAREYLEWMVLPREDIGFDGLMRGGILKPNQILLVQGIQEDELLARYRGFRAILYGIGFLSIIVNLMFAVYENVLKAHCMRLKHGTK